MGVGLGQPSFVSRIFELSRKMQSFKHSPSAMIDPLESQTGVVDELLDAAERWLEATDDPDMRDDARDAREEMKSLLPDYEAAIARLIPVIKRP